MEEINKNLKIAIIICYEAYERILDPPIVKGFEVLLIATTGLIANAWVAIKLHGHHDLNIKGACSGGIMALNFLNSMKSALYIHDP